MKTEKVVKGKKTTDYEYRRNIDKRIKFVETQGQEAFDRVAAIDENYAKLKDLPCPSECLWIWEHFMNIWNECERDFNGNVILTYGTILDYMECMAVPLNVAERTMVMKMKHWAVSEIAQLKDKED